MRKSLLTAAAALALLMPVPGKADVDASKLKSEAVLNRSDVTASKLKSVAVLTRVDFTASKLVAYAVIVKARPEVWIGQ